MFPTSGSLTDCMNSCLANDDCEAFTYDTQDRSDSCFFFVCTDGPICWLKNNIRLLNNPSGGYVSGVRCHVDAEWSTMDGIASTFYPTSVEEPSWSDWSEWSACTGSCGTGRRTQERACIPSLDNCGGDAFQEEECETGIVCREIV